MYLIKKIFLELFFIGITINLISGGLNITGFFWKNVF